MMSSVAAPGHPPTCRVDGWRMTGRFARSAPVRPRGMCTDGCRRPRCRDRPQEDLRGAMPGNRTAPRRHAQGAQPRIPGRRRPVRRPARRPGRSRCRRPRLVGLRPATSLARPPGCAGPVPGACHRRRGPASRRQRTAPAAYGLAAVADPDAWCAPFGISRPPMRPTPVADPPMMRVWPRRSAPRPRMATGTKPPAVMRRRGKVGSPRSARPARGSSGRDG